MCQLCISANHYISRNRYFSLKISSRQKVSICWKTQLRVAVSMQNTVCVCMTIMRVVTRGSEVQKKNNLDFRIYVKRSSGRQRKKSIFRRWSSVRPCGAVAAPRSPHRPLKVRRPLMSVALCRVDSSHSSQENLK